MMSTIQRKQSHKHLLTVCVTSKTLTNYYLQNNAMQLSYLPVAEYLPHT